MLVPFVNDIHPSQAGVTPERPLSIHVRITNLLSYDKEFVAEFRKSAKLVGLAGQSSISPREGALVARQRRLIFVGRL